MRKTPCELPYPGYAVEEFYLILPETLSVENYTPYRYEIDNDELRFITEWKPKNSYCLHCYYELMTKKDHVPSEKIEEWHKDSEQISNLISRTLFHQAEEQGIALTLESTPMFLSKLVYLILCIGSFLIWIYYMYK